jgi:hypothetical protein
MLSTKYEFTRTIRFNLAGNDTSGLHPAKTNESTEVTLQKFTAAYAQMLEEFEHAILYTKNDENVIKSKLQIKKTWLRQHARQEYYNLSESVRNNSKLTPNDALFLQNTMQQWLKNNKELVELISGTLGQPRYNQSRLSEIASYLRQLKSREGFYFVRDLTLPGVTNDKVTNQSLQNLRQKTDETENLLDAAQSAVAPNLENGIEIVRATFNYYTLNKISKNFDQEIAVEQQSLEQPYNKISNHLNLLKSISFAKDYPNPESLSLADFHEALKQFKSAQKSKFMESVAKGIPASQLISMYPLFATFSDKNETAEAKMDKFKNADKRKRGGYFRNKWGFQNFVKYCDDIYKPVSIKAGQIYAKIRALEQEKIDARLLEYWAHIVQAGNQKYLLLIPKNNMQQAKQYLEKLSEIGSEAYNLYSFNSLTLRALDKLVRRNLEKEQTDLTNEDEQKAINLYKQVLRGDFAQIQLDFSGFEKPIKEIISKQYANLEEFRIALEKISYHVATRNLDETSVRYLRDTYGATLHDITSYDLERDITGAEKAHTQLWHKFWSSENWQTEYPIRINPDIRLFYRPKRNDAEKYSHRSRFSSDHYGVAFTMSQNAAQQRPNTAFANQKAHTNMIETFNANVIDPFIKQKGEELYYYGIDRGQQELATLCVTRFSKEQYDAMQANGSVQKFAVPNFAPLELYRIKGDSLHATKQITSDKKGTRKTVTLYQNPSYFINDDVFEEITSPFVDLTTAKLIGDKIVLNGDIQTYINLKIASAKRQLFENRQEIDQNAGIEFNTTENRFQIKDSYERNGYKYLPYYPETLHKIKSMESFQEDLQNYLDNLRNDDATLTEETTINKVNHLRDAITANMVGVIAHLFETYPGIINLENLHSQNDIARHFNASNENIARRLEWSLYKKFQKTGLVPPRLRETIFLRENEIDGAKLNNFGIIHFIPTQNTSAQCPYCGETTSMQQRNKDKFALHAYICRKNPNNCGFDTRKPLLPLTPITDSDQVAAYNIAGSPSY